MKPIFNMFKYILDPDKRESDGSNIIELPKWSEIKSVIEQRGEIVVYAIVPSIVEEMQRHLFQVIGTGHNIPEDVLDYYKFLGTVSLRQGTLIFHIFHRRSTAGDYAQTQTTTS